MPKQTLFAHTPGGLLLYPTQLNAVAARLQNGVPAEITGDFVGTHLYSIRRITYQLHKLAAELNLLPVQLGALVVDVAGLKVHTLGSGLFVTDKEIPPSRLRGFVAWQY